MMAMILPVVNSSSLATIFLARWVMVQKRNKMVNELASPESAFTITATFDVSLPANKDANLVRSIKTGAPGGGPTSNLYPAAMNSPQSQKLDVDSIVDK